MKIIEILTPEHTRCDVRANSQKRVLQTISKLASQDLTTIDATNIMESLIAREKLGTTAIGHGIALPHTRIPGIDHTVGVLIRLDKPLDFAALDNQPVNLLFSLIAPEDAAEEHLETLGRLAKVFSDASFRARCLHAQSHQDLYNLAIAADAQMGANP